MDDNDLDVELSAMQQIAVALSSLDEPTRLRVLRWAAERIGTTAAVAAPRGVVLAAEPRLVVAADVEPLVDEALSVSALNDFFEPGEPRVLAMPAREAHQSVCGLLTDFVAEFQDIAHEWNAACDAPADEHAGETLTQRASNAA